MHDVGPHLLQRVLERRRDGRVVDLAVGVAEVKEPVGAVVHADQADPVLDPFDDLIRLLGLGRLDRGVKHGDLPAAPGQLLGGQAGDGRAAAAVVPAERGHEQPPGPPAGVGGAARAGARMRRSRQCARALTQLRRQPRHRQQPLLQGIGQTLKRLALGIGGVEHGPVELGHQLAQRIEVDRGLERPLDVGELARPRGLVGGVGAMAADGHERAPGDVAEAELASGAQEEVEVVGQRVAVVVAAHRLVHAAVHHA